MSGHRAMPPGDVTASIVCGLIAGIGLCAMQAAWSVTSLPLMTRLIGMVMGGLMVGGTVWVVWSCPDPPDTP